MKPGMTEWWRGWVLEYKKLVAATGFLSILPLPFARRLFAEHDGSPLLGGEYFPLVGLLLAALLVLGNLLVAPLLSQIVLAALLVVALVILTGGLHLDGLMDTCDGLFGGRTLERKLEIMRDSRVGSFGVLAGGCALLLKFACLASLGMHSLPSILFVVLPTARWALVLVLYAFPNARTQGLGVSYRRELNLQGVVLAGAMTLLIVLVSAGMVGLLVWAITSSLAFVLGGWITRKLGGLTGDTYGAIAEITEIACLLAFCLLHV